jgi:ribosome-associated toxin RatA of RatAB toxin-antitoxin module
MRLAKKTRMHLDAVAGLEPAGFRPHLCNTTAAAIIARLPQRGEQEQDCLLWLPPPMPTGKPAMTIAALCSLLIATMALLALPAKAAASIDIAVTRNHASQQAYFDIRASGFARATPERVWQVLTDYERQPNFVPNLLRARILSRNGPEVLLEQDGRSGFFIFQRAVHLQVLITEKSPTTIDVALVSGDMTRYSARWSMSPAEQAGVSGTRIDYTGAVEPNFFVPPLIGNAIVQTDIRKMLEAVITELEK